MRFMMLVTSDPATAPAGGPSQQLMAEVGKLLEEMTRAGCARTRCGSPGCRPG